MAQRVQRAHVLRQRQQQRAARQHHRQEEERLLRQLIHRVRHAQTQKRQPQALQTLLRRQPRLRVLQDRAEGGDRGEIEVLAELLEVLGENEAGLGRVVRENEQQQHYASSPQGAGTALPQVEQQHFLDGLHELRWIPAGRPTPRRLSRSTSSLWQPTLQLARCVARIDAMRSSSCFRSPWSSAKSGISAGSTRRLAMRMWQAKTAWWMART